MPRFVILRHEMPGGERQGVHWDLMLEQAGVLRTWALTEEPAAGKEIAADYLADHRLAYLEYEGPVSGDRGEVSRWDWGDYEPFVDSPDDVIVLLRGQRLNGTVRLVTTEQADQRWRFTFSG
jgi:DNA polymerase Ligase (LigD)